MFTNHNITGTNLHQWLWNSTHILTLINACGGSNWNKNKNKLEGTSPNYSAATIYSDFDSYNLSKQLIFIFIFDSILFRFQSFSITKK